MEADFSGYATKANLKCSDGRVIMPEAFAHMDGMTVPLVWQHMHNEPSNVLGHAELTARPDGMWAEAYFNGTNSGLHAKQLVQHGDVNSMSIYANQLVEKSKQVFHGVIREVSLVLSGANPGAKIENVRLAHGDGDFDVLDDEAVIFTGTELMHSNGASSDRQNDDSDNNDSNEENELDPQEVYDTLNDEQRSVVHEMIGAALEHSSDNVDDVISHASPDDMTVKDVYDSFTPVQKDVVHFMIGAALEQASNNSAAHSALNGTYQEGGNMPRNVFDQSNGQDDHSPVLSHSDLETIQNNALKCGSYKEAFLAHAESLGYGIDDIEFLFPDAKAVTSQPDLIARRTEWVAKVMDGAKHSPFARVKSLHADLTAEEARAKGYVKGNLKKEEVVKLLRRVTTPTTVYKKQKLDRDDIVDITDLDVVAWLKWEMRFMLEEEIARAILIGDGREPDDKDKIDEERLRPIAWDNEMYTHSVTIPTNSSPDALVESVIRARKFYRGTGTPTFFTTDDVLTDMLLIKDKVGRRLYSTETELAAALRVGSIVVVEVMEDAADVFGIIVNMADYTIGADKGGQLAMFDDFDIDYNQQKYLMETRISGALTKAKTAVVIKRSSGNTVVPQAPAFNEATNELTVPTVAGVKYYDVTDVTSETELTGKVTITRTTDVEARPLAGYHFPHNTDADWTFAFTG